MSGCGIASTLFPNMPLPPQLTPMYLTCSKCGIGKTSAEEMEIHIKKEHLNWLPFQCPVCGADRASDLEMREHMHSLHHKTTSKFIYVDNPAAKRLLQIYMDKSLSAIRRIPPNNGTSSSGDKGSQKTNGSQTNALRHQGVKHCEDFRAEELLSREQNIRQEQCAETPLRSIAAIANGTREQQQQSPPRSVTTTATAAIVSRKRPASTNALLSAIQAAQERGEPSGESGIPSDDVVDEMDDESFALAQILSNSRKNDFEQFNHLAGAQGPRSEHGLLRIAAGEEDDMSADPNDNLGIFAALLNVEDMDADGFRRRNVNGAYSSASFKANCNSVSKKRVLGECSNCKKPVTAGGRQLHMFFHLGKDYNIYRFRCKYPNCTTEHYRKDQMENHHSKQHGKVDASLMEDRIAELYDKCQELSMALLGTTGNVPGPTAAKAQFVHDVTIAAQAFSQSKKKKKHQIQFAARAAQVVQAVQAAQVLQVAQAAQAVPFVSNQSTPQIRNAKLEVSEVPAKQFGELDHSSEGPTLECRICKKMMFNRIRGFHILWHMTKDLGINRFVCKYCDFGHDRSQSVQTHGKTAHGVEDCVEDHIEDFTEEIKTMSEQCFGFQALFSQDSRRPSKIPMAVPRMAESDKVREESDESASLEHQDDEEEVADEAEAEPEEDVPETKPSLTESVTGHVAEGSLANLEADTSSGWKSGSGKNNGRNVSGNEKPMVTPKVEQLLTALSVSSSSTAARSRKSRSSCRFGIRKPPSLRRKDMARLREVRMRFGGAQYFKKKVNEAAHCEICGVLTQNRMSDHAYKHMKAHLFVCPRCGLGNPCRDAVVKHIRSSHGPDILPKDERMKYGIEIKDTIRQCYPAYFVDAPVLTMADWETFNAAYDNDAEGNRDLPVGSCYDGSFGPESGDPDHEHKKDGETTGEEADESQPAGIPGEDADDAMQDGKDGEDSGSSQDASKLIIAEEEEEEVEM